jgi:hypothetical protein
MMCTFGRSRVRPSIPRAPGHQGKGSLSVGPEPLQEFGILLPILLSHQITATVDPSGPLIYPLRSLKMGRSVPVSLSRVQTP